MHGWDVSVFAARFAEEGSFLGSVGTQYYAGGMWEGRTEQDRTGAMVNPRCRIDKRMGGIGCRGYEMVVGWYR